jgi:hypothetical protein
MCKFRKAFLLLLLSLMYASSGICQDSSHIVLRFVTGSGGVHFASDGQYFQCATIGESITGYTWNENNILRSGFWSSSFPFSSDIEESKQPLLPADFMLYQNYPNPFNPTTVIKYDIPKPSTVKLEVFNILGEKIITLVNSEAMSAGYRQVEWNGRNGSGNQVGSGIYIYRLEAKPETGKRLIQFIKKMIYLK